MPDQNSYTDLADINSQIADIENKIKKFKKDFPDREVPSFFQRQLSHLENLRYLHKKT